MRLPRGAAFFVVLVLALAACSSKASDNQADRTPAPSDAPTDAPTDTPTAIATGTTPPTSSATPTVQGTKTTAPGTTAPAPSLFNNETLGVTPSTITICSHVPLTGAAPIARSPSQTNVYWSWLNDNGGVNGRRVTSIVYDDTYSPTGAIAAVNKCKDRAFMVAGAAGVDQITAVAKWAKTNKVPYLHGPASTSSIGTNAYQFFMSPDYEYQHQLLADYIVNVLKKTKIAMVRLDSPHFEAGAKAFRDRLKSRYGISLVADLKVVNGQQSFAALAGPLGGADVINNFTNPVTWINMMLQFAQTAPQLLNKQWTAVSPVAYLNTVIGTIGALIGDRAHVFSFTPRFKDDSSLPYFSEIDKFLKAFVKYTGKARKDADDVDWTAWLVNKQIGAALAGAGKNPTRSGLVAYLQKLKQTSSQASPSCALDFTKDPASTNRRGSWAVNVFRSAAGSVWSQIRTCAGSF